MVFLLFCFKLILFFGIGGLAVYSLLSKYTVESNCQKTEYLLYSVGMGPALASLMLYYLLVLIPYKNSLFYLSIIFIVFLVMIAVNRPAIKDYVDLFQKLYGKSKEVFVKQDNLKAYFKHNNNAFLIIIAVLLILGLSNLFLLAVPGHDFLVYMVQGNELFLDKAIVYTDHLYNPETGFYYVGLHGWSFPLQSTMEKMVDDCFFFGYDLYFKSLTLLYGLLLLTIVYYLGKRTFGNIYAVLMVMVLVLAKGYFISLLYSHIDSYRIFFYTVSTVFVLRQLDKPQWKTLPIIGFLVGTSGFSHSLGIILSVIVGAALLFFIPKNLKYRLKYLAVFTILVLAFGGFHYILDVFYGTGWIFKKIDFY